MCPNCDDPMAGRVRVPLTICAAFPRSCSEDGEPFSSVQCTRSSSRSHDRHQSAVMRSSRGPGASGSMKEPPVSPPTIGSIEVTTRPASHRTGQVIGWG